MNVFSVCYYIWKEYPEEVAARWRRSEERYLLRRKFVRRISIVAELLLTGASCAFAQSDSGPEAWDANHDGVYTCDEWKSHLDRIFTLADRNHDGRLDAAEFATVRRADSTLADADFGYFDENQDGKITRSEFVGKPSEFILRFDKNGDCRVTPDEMKATAPAQKGPPDKPRDRWH